MEHDYQALVDVLKRYYDGLYRCDTGILGAVFHADAQYVTASDRDLLHLDMQTYFSIVDKRTSPHSLGEPYRYEIESIEFAGPVTAFARMRCFMLSKDYTDFLSFIRVDGKWQIIAKVFHVEPAREPKQQEVDKCPT